MSVGAIIYLACSILNAICVGMYISTAINRFGEYEKVGGILSLVLAFLSLSLSVLFAYAGVVLWTRSLAV